MSAQSVLEERVTLASTSTVAPPRTTSVLESLQGRQVGRLKPELVDKQGRIMLKNLTKAELLMWLEQQGSVLEADLTSHGKKQLVTNTVILYQKGRNVWP